MSDKFDHPINELATYRELTPAERQAVHAHLAVCEECRAQFEAFQRQEALLALLPQAAITTRAAITPRWRQAGFWSGLARLGDVMAVGGLAVMTIAAVLIVHALAAAPPQTGSAPPAPGAPLALPPDLPVLVNPWILAAPWIGGASSIIGLLLALGQRNRKWAVLGVLVAAILLSGFVPPLSLLPNPVGLFWHVIGGYSYDPNLPFRNLFVLSGDPAAQLRPYLDRLIGQTGLDPLDPVQPLARYTFERVSLPRGKQVALVTTRFTYADGSSRVHDVPLFDPIPGPFGFYVLTWQNDGLARLRTEHLALPGQPFATETSPVRLGDPVRLQLSPQADRLDATNPAHWLWISNRLQRMVWSPQGDAFLMVEQRANATWQLWLVPLDGSTPQPVNRSGSVFEYGWSPDARFIVYTASGELQVSSSARAEAAQLVVARRDAPTEPVARRAISNASLPSLTRQGIWYVQDGALWAMDYQTGDSIRVVGLPGIGQATDVLPTFWPMAVSPEASYVAYACGNDLCLIDLGGSSTHVVKAASVRSITWDAAGTRLAAVSLDKNNFGPVRLLVVSRDGQVQQDAEIAPRDATDPPQWTPDDKIAFVQTFPMGGRRILTVNADTGQVLDLSREHWDAYFALSPDGQSLLLNNGRGGFWLVPIIR